MTPGLGGCPTTTPTGVPPTSRTSVGAASAGAVPRKRTAPIAAATLRLRYFTLFPPQISPAAALKRQPKVAYWASLP
jgi:hypothetical protein